MSSKGRSADGYEADPHGFFETQPEVTRAGLTFWGIEPGMRILQPGCGTGAIAKVLRRRFGSSIEIVGVEIDKKRAKKAATATVIVGPSPGDTIDAEYEEPVYNEIVHADFFTYENPFPKKFDYAIENPSFAIWKRVAEQCFQMADRTSLLIPWNSAASMDRAAWWREHPAYLRILSKRPSFAQSVKCAYTNAKRAKQDNAAICTYQRLISLSAKPKKTCPLCGAYTTITRSDSNEYCWATWSSESSINLWDPLDTPLPIPEDYP